MDRSSCQSIESNCSHEGDKPQRFFSGQEASYGVVRRSQRFEKSGDLCGNFGAAQHFRWYEGYVHSLSGANYIMCSCGSLLFYN
jgi:hypothetical protein